MWGRKEKYKHRKKRLREQESGVGVRDGGRKSGEEEGWESRMAAHQS